MRYQTNAKGESTYLLGNFNTGETVTITLYNLATGSSITLTSNSCSEIGTTGLFRWSTSNITTQPTSRTEYTYIMTDSAGFVDFGKIVLGGYVDNVDGVISSLAPSGEYDAQLDATISSRAPASEYDTEIARLDTTVSSRSSHSPSDVWAVTTRTLSSFGTLVADIWANVARTLTAGTKDAEIDAIKAKTDTINWPEVVALLKIETNRWKIVSNQFIIYDDDKVTPLYTFDLKDNLGQATEDSPKERTPA